MDVRADKDSFADIIEHDLELEYAEKTLGYVHQLWARKVHLETVVNQEPVLLTFSDDDFSTQKNSPSTIN